MFLSTLYGLCALSVPKAVLVPECPTWGTEDRTGHDLSRPVFLFSFGLAVMV